MRKFLHASTILVCFGFLAPVSGLMSRVHAQEARLSVINLPDFEKRLDELSAACEAGWKTHMVALEKLTNKEADAEILYQRRMRGVDHACLSELLILAQDLSIVVNPPEALAAVKPGGAPVPSKVLSLRRDIDQAERERIAGALRSHLPLHGDERTEKAIYRKELSLDALFERESSRPLREVESVRRSIIREKKLRSPDSSKIAAWEKQIESAQQAVDQLVPVYFGHPAGVGFEYDSGWPADHPAEVLRLRILKSAREIAARIAEHSEKGGENGGAYGDIGGTSIYSENLGVVLDVSGSMTSFIEPLKKEIAKSFSGPRYRQVTGCSLLFAPRQGKPPVVDASRDTLAVIEELVTVHKVDTVYWFCDLQDPRNPAALRRLRHLLRRGGVAFHIKSVDRSPDRDLEPLITSFKR